MKNKTVNKKVLRAMSIGLAAMMTVQPILATPVFADDTEPVDDSNTNYEEGTESEASEESSESTESAAPSVSEATTNTIEVVNEITGYTNAAGDAAINTNSSISYATDLNELSTAENGQSVFPNDITTGKPNPVNEGEYIQTQDNEIKTAMGSAVSADDPAKDAAGNATTELKEAVEALSNVKEVEETKDTEESKDSSIIENKEAATDAANNAEEAVKTGNENVDKAIEAINNATSIAAAAQSAEEGNKAIADAKQAVSQYGDELEAARDRFIKAAENAKDAEKAYNTAAKEAKDAITLAEEKYQDELNAIEEAIGKVNSSADALEDKTVKAAVERFNAFVTDELGYASLAWTEEELKKTPEERKKIAEEKYTNVRNIAAEKKDAAKEALTVAEAAYNNAMADKKAAEEEWAAITDEGLKAVAEAQYKCDMTKSCDWAENGALNTLFEKVVKYYYVENKLLAEGDKLVDGVNVEFEHRSNPDLNNYFVVTYQVETDGTVENVTKYLNFKAGDKNKTKNALIIFERSDEIVFNEGTDTQFTALKTDLSFNDHGEADYQTEDGKDYKIVNVDGEYFALEISDGIIADGNTTTDYSEEDGYTKNEVKDYHYEVIEENGKKSLAKVVTGDAVKLVIRDKDTMDKVGDTEVENYYDWNDANELLESIQNQPGYEAYEGKDGLRVTWRPCKETSKYESAIFDEEGNLIVKDSKLYDTKEAAIAACVEWARQKENYKNIFPTSGDEDRVKSVDMEAVMVKTGEETVTKKVVSGFDDSDITKIFNSEQEAQDAINSIGTELKGIDKDGLKVVSKADGYIAEQKCKLTFTTKVDLSGVRVTVPQKKLSENLKAIFGNDENARSKAISALNNLFNTYEDLETELDGYTIDSISVDVDRDNLKDDNSYWSFGTETREITKGAVYITYSKSINVISEEKKSEAEAISDANAKYDDISEQRDSVIDLAIASWTKDKLSNYRGTAKGWFIDHKVFTEGYAWDTSIKDKKASAVKDKDKKTKVGDASTSVTSYKYSYEGTYSYKQDINKYYYTAEWTSPMRMVIGKYDVRTSDTELSRTVYGAGNATVNINASNALYDRFAKDSSKTDGLFFTYGENEDEGYKDWLNNSVTLYKNVKDAENAVKEKLVSRDAKLGELNSANALFNKANNLTKEQRTAMEKAYAYQTALGALAAQKDAANNAKVALEEAKANLIALNKAFDSEYMTEVDVAEINEDGTVSVSKKKVSKLSLYEEEVKKAEEAYKKALEDLSILLDRVIELEGAYNDAVIRLTPAPATGGEETSPAGGGTTALAPATTLATTLAGAPAFTLPLVGDAAPATGVAGARTIRGAADSDSDSTATDTTAKIAPEKEVEEDALAITKDTIKTIKDNETPLSSLTEDSTQKMNWWWLLLIALFGATGEEIYRRNKKKKEEAALEAEINKK